MRVDRRVRGGDERWQKQEAREKRNGYEPVEARGVRL